MSPRRFPLRQRSHRHPVREHIPLSLHGTNTAESNLSIVLLVTDNATNPILNPTEVTHLFSMPLPAFLYDRPSLIPGWYFGLSNRVSSDPAQKLPPPEIDYADGQGRVGGKEGRYYQYRDVYWGSGVVRMHRFLTGREGGGVKPVYGLTA